MLPTSDSASPNMRLITPPDQEEVVHPYRRVWGSIIIELSIVFMACAILIVSTLFIDFPSRLWIPLNVALAISPLVAWAIFSWLRERFVPQPRARLFVVVLLSALIARSVGSPLLNQVLAIEMWVPKLEFFERIIVYSLSLGVIQEVLKYLVIRYVVWVDQIRYRYDAIAYAVAGAIGYATVLIFEYLLGQPPPSAMAVHVFSTLSLHLTGSIIISYAIAETRLSRASPILLVGVMSLASLFIGFIYTLSGNLSNTRISFGISTPRTFIGFALVTMLITGVVLAMIFLYSNADRNDQQIEQTA